MGGWTFGPRLVASCQKKAKPWLGLQASRALFRVVQSWSRGISHGKLRPVEGCAGTSGKARPELDQGGDQNLRRGHGTVSNQSSLAVAAALPREPWKSGHSIGPLPIEVPQSTRTAPTPELTSNDLADSSCRERRERSSSRKAVRLARSPVEGSAATTRVDVPSTDNECPGPGEVISRGYGTTAWLVRPKVERVARRSYVTVSATVVVLVSGKNWDLSKAFQGPV